MIAVIQRVSESSVTIDEKVKASIGHGLMVLIGIEDADSIEDIEWLTKKIVNLRIFDDAQGVMNENILQHNGDILVISQFTLHASTKKGNRPSYIKASKPDVAIPLYNQFLKTLSQELGKEIKSGEFGAMMQVSLINSGPVTIIMDTKNKN